MVAGVSTTPRLDPVLSNLGQFLTGRLRANLGDTPGDLAMTLDRASTTQTPALELIDQALLDVAEGRSLRQMIFMPPQEGKSQRVSRRFPTWLLSKDPSLRVAIVSYQQGKAERWGLQVKRDVETHPELGIRIRGDSKAKGRWQTLEGGGIYSVGIGGALTGEPVDVLIIDDPFSGRAEAESETYRARAWDWWENVGSTRLSARGRVLLMMTRWHEDDLAGRLLTREPGEWSALSIPAICENPVGDPLGRAEGEEMVSATHKPGHFEAVRALRSPYVWRSVYQQAPTAGEGNLFKRTDFRFWRPGAPDVHGDMIAQDGTPADLRDCYRFATIDLATSTKTSADYTVAAAWAIVPWGDLVLLDRVRVRVPEEGHFDTLTPLRQRWLRPYDVTYVESRMFGTTLVYAAGRAGIPLAELKADADKVTRAMPAADLNRQHRLWFPADLDDLDGWCDELAQFPNGAHDDQVDVTAYAARVAVAHWLPAQAPGVVEREMAAAAGGMSAVIAHAHQVDGWGTTDPLQADW
jgi:predicted phage terminase large subunit-like protein